MTGGGQLKLCGGQGAGQIGFINGNCRLRDCQWCGSFWAVQFHRTVRGLRKVAKPAIAGLLVGLLFFAVTLSVCPSLHQYLHHDAGEPDHHCLISLFAQGQVNAADGAVAVIAFFLAVVYFTAWALTCASPAPDFRLSPSRAPPLS